MPRAALLRAARRAALTSGAALAAGSAALTSCADAPSLVTDWSSPEKAKQLEVSYQRAEVRAQRAAMIAMLRPETGERILDVGCGPGYLVAQLAAQRDRPLFSKLILYGSIYDPFTRYPREPLYTTAYQTQQQHPRRRSGRLHDRGDDPAEGGGGIRRCGLVSRSRQGGMETLAPI